FFSSRRRHTRCYRDWSSDVCSSDLSPALIPVDIRRVPANISVITQKEIKESGARTIQEVLQYQPGVTIFDQVGNDFQQTIVLRGFVNDGIIPVTVLVDGVRVNAPDFNAVDFDVVPFEDVERIEI